MMPTPQPNTDAERETARLLARCYALILQWEKDAPADSLGNGAAGASDITPPAQAGAKGKELHGTGYN